MNLVVVTLEKNLLSKMDDKKEKQNVMIKFKYVSAWEYKGEPSEAVLHKEELEFNDIELKTRSYK